MAVIDDIIAARDAAVHIFDQEIVDALTKQNAAANDTQANRFDGPIHKLMVQRVQIYEQAADDAMNSQEMLAALAQLRLLTSDLNNLAARMGSVTGFFNNFSALLKAGSKVVDVLKGPETG